MIESYVRPTYDRIFAVPLALRVSSNLKANQATFLAGLTGVSIIPLLYFGLTKTAVIMLFISGYLDTLDGAIARFNCEATPKGTVLDITTDRVVEASIILGLYLVDPASRAWLSLLMLSSILICVTTFLIVGVFTPNKSDKQFHYSPGLMERFEAFLFFAAMILFPHHFLILSTIFIALTLLTAFFRVNDFMRDQ